MEFVKQIPRSFFETPQAFVFLTPFTNRSRLFSENPAECQATPLGPNYTVYSALNVSINSSFVTQI
jgi:hypothetical protein